MTVNRDTPSSAGACWLSPRGRSEPAVSSRCVRCRPGGSWDGPKTSDALRLGPEGVSCREGPRSAAAVDVDEVDAHVLLAAQRLDNGAERGRRPPGPADDATEIVGIDQDLERLATVAEPRVATALSAMPDAHLDVVGVVDNAADQVVERVGEDCHAWSALDSSAASSPLSA